MDDHLTEALNAARERGREKLAEFARLGYEEQVEEVARLIYYCSQVDPHGYPNGMATWDELPELDPDYKLGYDKERYRHAARSVFSLLPYLKVNDNAGD